MALRRPGDKPLSEAMMVSLYASLGLNELTVPKADLYTGTYMCHSAWIHYQRTFEKKSYTCFFTDTLP